MPIKVSINVSKIEKDRLFQGKSGKYLDCVLFDKPDSYGNDGFVAHDVSKEEREAGTRGAIIGNWRVLGRKPESAPLPKRPMPQQKPPPPMPTRGRVPEDDIPF